MGIEATLDELQPNPLEVQLRKMQDTAIEIARYYFDGFSAHLTTMMGNVELAHNHSDDPKYREMAIEAVDFINTFYARIPFPTLEGRIEFNSLFTVKRLLPHLRSDIIEALNSYNARAMKNLERTTQTIEGVGALYRETLFKLLAEIRTHPGREKFSVSVIDPREPERVTVY